MTSPPVNRRAARVLLLDSQDRVLLFRGGDPSNPDAGTWWFTVGGGIGPGEPLVVAAARELFEETGLRCAAADLGDPVFEEVSPFSFGGRMIVQSNTFFLLRIAEHEVNTQGFEQLETDSIFEHRWWHREDLRTTSDSVYPRDLVALLDRVA